MNEYKYTIGNKVYSQRELVWLQIKQLLAIIKDLRFESMEVAGIVATLGEKIDQALAVVLIPAGTAIKDKTRDLDAFADELSSDLTPSTILQVVADFFACNPIASLSEQLAGTIDQVRGNVEKITASIKSSVSSPVETLPEATS